MDNGTTATALLAIAAAGIIVLTLRIGASATGQVRERFLVLLQRFRMRRMLDKRHIDADDYLKQPDPSEIRRQLAACENCAATAQCDAALLEPDEAKQPADYSYCPNDAVLSGLPQRLTIQRGSGSVEVGTETNV